MSATAVKHINTKLKNLPDALVEEVEKYIDFLAFKYAQENSTIPQWQQDIVLRRVKDKKTPVDAFTMIDDLEKSNEKI